MEYVRYLYSFFCPQPIELTDADFKFFPMRIQITHPRAKFGGIVTFKMNWCRYCRQNDTLLQELVRACPSSAIMTLEGTEHPETMHAVSKRGMIRNGFPSTYRVSKGGFIERVFEGERSVDRYKQFISSSPDAYP